jgi:CheY-like chemotaxis protein/cytochrome c-type biogenesis protein CcmH/NrfG
MGKTILLVEDDAIARKSLERLILSDPRLAAIEPRVVQAASGQQGLAVYVSERPDLIITDLYMPAMDGFSLCRSIREAPFGKDVPIIVTSGIYKDPALASSLGDEVQARFLPKPLQADDLMRTILTCLGEPLPAQEDAGQSKPQPHHRPEDEMPDPSTAFRPTVPRDVAIDLIGLEPPPPRPEPPPPLPIPSLGPDAFVSPSAGNPIGAGSLEKKHVARLIFDLAETSATGTLSLAHGKVRKDLYVREGQVVAADSNLRQEALGTLLCARGILDEGQLTFLLAETKKRGHKMGAVLIELGWLTPEEVLQCLAAQARKRIVDCLRWDEGSYGFTPGDTFGDRVIEHDLDVAKSVLLGLYRSATPETLVARFDQSGACPVQLTQRFDRYKTQFDETFGGDVSEIIADAPTVGALALREDAHVMMAEIEALIETGLADLGEPMEETDASPSTLESSFSLEKLGAELNKRFEAIVRNPESMSFSEIRKTEGLPTPGYARTAEESNSGALDIGYSTKSERRTGEHAIASPSSDLRQRLLHEYLMIHGKSHYEILGVTAQTPTRQIEEAVRARLETFSDRGVAGAELAPADRARLDAVRAAITQAGRILCVPAERTDYDQKLVTSQTATIDPLGAELAFGEAMQLFQAERFDEALAKFEAAVSARPDQALYHAYLGWAGFVAQGPDKASEARDRLHHALALDPDLAEAHALLGRLAATEDDARTARRHLEQSLTLEPEQADSVALLLEAYSRLTEPDPRGTERFLRKLVSALGERAESLRQRIWLALGALYENELADRNSARIAYDTAARLAPSHIESVRKSVELNAEDPTRWRETAHALAAEWRLHPNDSGPATKLLTLFEQQGQRDSVAATAAAMVLRDLADEVTRKLADSTRPRSLRKISGALPANLLARAGYRPEESDLEALAALLVETRVLKPFSRDELGLMESDVPLPNDAQPAAFRDVMTYVCGLFQTPEPEAVISLPVLGADARMADIRPPALLCGQLLLASEDTVELGFRLGRAMALSAPGRRAGSARSGGQMRPYFVAALALANAAGPVKGAAAQEASRAIAALDTTAQARILEIVQSIKQKYDNLNLTVWGRGLARVATRLALLITGDVLRIGRAVVEEDGPAALDDLLAFALSLDYLDLRQDLGNAAT